VPSLAKGKQASWGFLEAHIEGLWFNVGDTVAREPASPLLADSVTPVLSSPPSPGGPVGGRAKAGIWADKANSGRRMRVQTPPPGDLRSLCFDIARIRMFALWPVMWIGVDALHGSFATIFVHG
jgi:hypothetical protein